jgi:hypothetical protein
MHYIKKMLVCNIPPYAWTVLEEEIYTIQGDDDKLKIYLLSCKN